MDVGDTLSERIADGLEAAVTKYFDRSFDANVTVEKRGHEVITDCNVHLPSGIVLQSTGAASDPYASLEESLARRRRGDGGPGPSLPCAGASEANSGVRASITATPVEITIQTCTVPPLSV